MVLLSVSARPAAVRRPRPASVPAAAATAGRLAAGRPARAGPPDRRAPAAPDRDRGRAWVPDGAARIGCSCGSCAAGHACRLARRACANSVPAGSGWPGFFAATDAGGARRYRLVSRIGGLLRSAGVATWAVRCARSRRQAMSARNAASRRRCRPTQRSYVPLNSIDARGELPCVETLAPRAEITAYRRLAAAYSSAFSFLCPLADRDVLPRPHA